jgi:hypothetical protein
LVGTRLGRTLSGGLNARATQSSLLPGIIARFHKLKFGIRVLQHPLGGQPKLLNTALRALSFNPPNLAF